MEYTNNNSNIQNTNNRTTAHNTNFNTSNISSHTFFDKLRPSSKNRVITKKYSNLNSNENSQVAFEKEWGIEPIVSDGNTTQQSFNIKWSNIVRQTKREAMNLNLDLSTSALFPSGGKNTLDDYSMMSENMEYINNFIEENYQMVLTENIFITNPDSYHSILPFLLIKSREIHRATLSDYEIKLVIRAFKKKYKTNRIDGMDYYKLGLIYFYSGKFLLAYSNFKTALKIAKKDANMAKWLAFTCLVIIFCYSVGSNNSNSKNSLINVKVDFSGIKNVVIVDVKEEYEEEQSFLFACCTNRKKKIHTSTITASHMPKNEIIGENNTQVNRFSLCKETEELLLEVLNLDKEGKHSIEINWMYMIISTYAVMRPEQKAFTDLKSSPLTLDPKLCAKKIKEKDIYLGYIAYTEYQYLINPNYQIKSIYSELIAKYPTRIEAYLKFWYYLVKSKEKDYKLAHQLSEVFWRNSSTIKFDNSIY
jgi:hypothetical protein